MRFAVIVFGILLVVVGTGVLISQGVTVTTLGRQVVALGPLTASTQPAHSTIPMPPVAGGIVLAAGSILILAAAGRSRHHKGHELKEAGSS